mmetsp:Transcript_14734/g.31829  ORF Transcript_14734/g.31829 Transcript_14734/m.31829 type:complete len:693 (-) Transcript_14734:201-2279(-)
MGFADTIEAEAHEPHRQYYLRYTQLKELVSELSKDESAQLRSRIKSADFMDMQARPASRFQETLRGELQKVNQFACVKHEALFLGLRRVCDECNNLGKQARSLAPGQSLATELEKMRGEILAFSDEIVHLDTYVRLNYIGFQKLTRKFDACLGISGSALFVAGLHTEAFCNVRFDDILILLGLAWSRWRSCMTAEQSKDATWKPPESFVRNTAKYWVRPDKVVLLKTRIVEHLPYLIFGASTAEQEKLLDPFALLDLDYQGFDIQSSMGAYTGTMEESQLLSSVYFDSPDAVSYQERIHREEGARLVRFRWYGENNLEPDKEVYIERKIHHEGWGSAQSAKERAILPQKDVLSYMNGKFDIDGYFSQLAAEGRYSDKARKAMKGICHEVHDMIQNKKLQPIIRTSYYRCAFQLATSNEVRVSLDTQMSLLNEFREGGHHEEPWCKISSDLLRKDEIYRFPFAILEIKLQNVSETPLWLRQTLADIGAIQVHKFSKFQHAMAFLHPEKVPILPHWHKDFQDWHDQRERLVNMRVANKSVSKVLQSDTDTQEDFDVPNISKVVAPNGVGHFLKDMQNLDPKGIFANERTLLHYAEKGLYLSGLSAILLYQPHSAARASGLTLAVCTAIFFVWALVEYYARLGRIVGRAKVGKDSTLRLDWVLGPLVVGALILLVLAISVVEAAIKVRAKTGIND